MALDCQKGTEIVTEDSNVSKILDRYETKEAGSNQISSNNSQSGKGIVSIEANSCSKLHGKGGFEHEIVSEHQAWKDFYCEWWGPPIRVEEAAGPEGGDEKSWKKLFVEKEFRSKLFLGHFKCYTLYGHAEDVRTVFVLASKKIVFTCGYDQSVRMWDLEEGLAIASSISLGCVIRAVTADVNLLIAGGTNGYIHGWKAMDGNPHLFDIRAQNHNLEFRIREHEGAITCLALDFTKIYSGSGDKTVRIWDRSSLQCVNILFHSERVYSLSLHDTTIVTASGSGLCIWDNVSWLQLAVINSVHNGGMLSLVRSHNGKHLFTGGEDGSIYMHEISGNAIQKIAKWVPHTDEVSSLAFEFPWLISASYDGKLSLIDVRKHSRGRISKVVHFDEKNVEPPPQRMLDGFLFNIYSVDVGPDRIVCGGEKGIVVRIWKF